MPEYFWIILASIIFLAIGFMVGYWISNKDRNKEIKGFHHKLEKVNEKLEALERSFPPSASVVQVRTKTYSSKASSAHRLGEDILGVADKLNEIINVVKVKPRVLESKAIKEEPKITIGNRTEDEYTVYDDNPNSVEHLPTLPINETENYNYNSQYEYQEPSVQIIQLYNRGVDNRSDRNLFREKYLITRLGNNKAIEQRLGETAKPEFRELGNGNFLAVSSVDGSFYVLPWFDTTLNSSAFNEGGFGYVFDCPDYNPEFAYTVVRVKRPAIFRKDSDNWTRVEKGELILQQ